MLKDLFNEQIIVHNSYYTLRISNGKHSTVLCMQLFSLCKCNENNWSYLKNNQYVGENNGKFLRIAEYNNR